MSYPTKTLRLLIPLSALVLIFGPIGCDSDDSGPNLVVAPADGSPSPEGSTPSPSTETPTEPGESAQPTESEAPESTPSEDESPGEVEQPDGPGDPLDNPPSQECTKNGFQSVKSALSEPQQGVKVFESLSSEGAPTDALVFEFYNGNGFSGATGPGSYDLKGANYADCANCVLVYAECGDSGCQKIFLADEGTLKIDTWEAGGTFSGSLEGVIAKEVAINQQTFESSVIPGGDLWCLDGVSFSVDVPEPVEMPRGGPAEANCVAEGTGGYVGDNIADYTLTNCLGEEVSLHARCGETKALWMIATAGWCGACSQHIEFLADKYGGILSYDGIQSVDPGLDIWVLLSETDTGAAPSEAYCKDYAERHNIDPAMLLIDHSVEANTINLIAPQGASVEVNGLGTTWQHVDPYLVQNGLDVGWAFPWFAVLRGTNMEYVWSDYSNSGDLDSVMADLLQ